MAFDPLHRDNAWVAWAYGGHSELDHNKHAQSLAHAPAGSITALAFDPASGQLYVRFALGNGNPFTAAGVYRLDRATNRFVPIHAVPLGPLGALAYYLAITRTGYLVTAADGSRLVIVKPASRAG
jgi:hypothetical protein